MWDEKEGRKKVKKEGQVHVLLLVRKMHIHIYIVHVHIQYTYSECTCTCTCTCIHACAVLLCLVCLTLLASFFLPSHLSFKNMYMYIIIRKSKVTIDVHVHVHVHVGVLHIVTVLQCYYNIISTCIIILYYIHVHQLCIHDSVFTVIEVIALSHHNIDVALSSSVGEGQYRCPRAVSTALCVHDVQCLDPECRGHGECGGTECSCESPWTGVTCATLNCSTTDCSGHGNCSDGTACMSCRSSVCMS